MSESHTKTRFAPSPTGEMHLGNMRTALFNALLARSRRGRFVLRIEDTDLQRSKAAYAEALVRELRWLGIGWDEGPYYQAQRGDVYVQHFEALEARGMTYPCFCGAGELALARRAQRAAGQPPRYPGTCAHLSAEEVRRKAAAGLAPAMRFRVAPDQRIEFDDLVRGRQRFRSDEIGDFIIRRSDGSFAFFFTNAVDDALMGVTHVLRGEDHLANTPRQLMLMQALGLQAPAYGHLSLLVGPDGAPLSKRHGSRSVRQLREQGYLPGALLNYVARLGHSCDTDAYCDLGRLAAAFSVDRLGRAPARFDEDQLRHWQKQAVAAAGVDELLDWFRSGAQQAQSGSPYDDQTLAGVLGVVRDNIVMPADLAAWVGRLAGEQIEPDAAAARMLEDAGRAFFQHAVEAVGTAEDFPTFAAAVGAAAQVRGRALFMPLRVALTGVSHGPEMQRVWEWLGHDRCRARLQRVLNRWSQGSRANA